MPADRIDLADLVTFPVRLASELLRTPETLRALRELTDDLAATSRVVRETIGDVADTLDPLSGAVDRVANIDRAVTELHAVFSPSSTGFRGASVSACPPPTTTRSSRATERRAPRETLCE